MTTEQLDNINISDSANNNDLLLSKLALLAQQANVTPEGEKPNNEELAMLLDDQLSFTRKQQVISHINADSNLMQQWISLVEILACDTKTLKSKQDKPSLMTPLLNYLSSWQGLTSSLATASLVVIVFIMQTPQQLSPNIEMQPDVAAIDAIKKTNKAFISPDIRAISAGILNYSKTHNTPYFDAINLSNAIDSAGSSLSEALYQQYANLGYLIAAQHLECKNSSQQVIINRKRLSKITALITTLADESFLPLANNLLKIGDIKNSKQRCEQINTFLVSEF